VLSRTADSLYWMARYVERAENLARMLDVTYRMALLPGGAGQMSADWRSVLVIAGQSEVFYEHHAETEVSPRHVIEYLALDPENMGSILTCIRRAREAARAMPGAVTTEMWESINGTWLKMRETEMSSVSRAGYREFFEWVKKRAHLFRGVVYGTMLQDEAFQFLRLGWLLERADNTARILDVKYHILLPESEPVGGVIDYYQWGALLRSVSAYKAYRRLYRSGLRPWEVAEFLVLCVDMPRSLHHCLREIDGVFGQLRQLYGSDLECYRLAGEIYSRLRYGRMDDIFRRGLHEFLSGFVEDLAVLNDRIARDFLLVA
jgi:uncharacterized alpha-E superfamily protein